MEGGGLYAVKQTSFSESMYTSLYLWRCSFTKAQFLGWRQGNESKNEQRRDAVFASAAPTLKNSSCVPYTRSEINLTSSRGLSDAARSKQHSKQN